MLRSFVTAASIAIGSLAVAQTLPPPSRPRRPTPAIDAIDANDATAGPIVELNLSGSVPLPQLVEVLGRQMGVRYLYADALASRRVTVFTPTKLPASAVPILLGTLLKAENLAIVDSDLPGFKRIVDFKDMTPDATIGKFNEVLRRDGPAAAVTQVFEVRHIDPTGLFNQLKPFLSGGANFVTLADAKLILVTDYAENVQTVARLLEIIDRPVDAGVIEFYVTRRRPAAVLIEQVQSLLAGEGDPPRPTRYRLFDDAPGGRVIVAGPEGVVAKIVDLLRRLDTGTDVETKLYKLQNVAASRIATLADRLAGGGGRPGDGRGPDDAPERAIETTVDEEGNLLIVRASPEVHQQIRQLVVELDVPVRADESPIRFYKLRNANAGEVLLSLLSLQQAAGVGGATIGGVAPTGYNPALGTLGTTAGIGGFGLGGIGLSGVVPLNAATAGFGNPNLGVTTAGGPIGGVPIGGVTAAGNVIPGSNLGGSPLNGNVPNFSSSAASNLNANLGAGGLLGGIGGPIGGGGVATLPGGARVSADVATNSLIVVAPSSVQPLYERLIRSLDRRRPQVMIRADIVAIDTTNNFRLGVEVVFGDRNFTRRAFAFSQFGLTEINALTGELTAINEALGFNGVVLDSDVADAVVQALSSNTRSRVLASPKVLVNDNETGTLESVASVPFQTLGIGNNASVATLGGNQQAGTTISVTPQINENDFLQLAFEVEFSTFTGGGSDTLPPARQIDRIGSVVTVPDGQTIVVGGLQQFNENDSFTGIPLLQRVPVLRELSSLTTRNDSTMSFFLFIRPTILRDSRFRDLRYLSDVDATAATLQGDEPDATPILIDSACPPPPVHPVVSDVPVGPPLVDPVDDAVCERVPEAIIEMTRVYDRIDDDGSPVLGAPVLGTPVLIED